jgi:outer membrane lipoprotein-sorting protein
VKVDLRWKDAKPGAALDASLFRLSPPAGARVVDLDAEPAR